MTNGSRSSIVNLREMEKISSIQTCIWKKSALILSILQVNFPPAGLSPAATVKKATTKIYLWDTAINLWWIFPRNKRILRGPTHQTLIWDWQEAEAKNKLFQQSNHLIVSVMMGTFAKNSIHTILHSLETIFLNKAKAKEPFFRAWKIRMESELDWRDSNGW